MPPLSMIEIQKEMYLSSLETLVEKMHMSEHVNSGVKSTVTDLTRN